VTLAGYGYPYVSLNGPHVPVDLNASFDCDVWWNEVAPDSNGGLVATGHRIADVVGFGDNLDQAVAAAYKNIKQIRALGSYYRQDIGRSLWPPGQD